jgi:hypothetical protein
VRIKGTVVLLSRNLKSVFRNRFFFLPPQFNLQVGIKCTLMIVRKLIAVQVCGLLLLGFVLGIEPAGRGARAADAYAVAATAQTVSHGARRKRRHKAVKKMSDGNKGAAGKLAAGTWGGQHIRLSVRADGAEVEFDCASGTLAGPLTLSADGRFDARGTFMREGGPTRIDANRTGQAARFEGHVSGRQLTLKVTLTDTAQDAGTFTLTHGSEGRLWKCR